MTDQSRKLTGPRLAREHQTPTLPPATMHGMSATVHTKRAPRERTREPSALDAELELDRVRNSRLPRQLIWLYLLGPLLTAPLFFHDLLSMPAAEIACCVAVNYLPFLAIPAACHAVYAGPIPPRIARIRSGAVRLLAHAALSTTVALVVAAVIWPLQTALTSDDKSLFTWMMTCVVITCAFILPTVVVQDARARARAIELRARIERHAAIEAQLVALQARTNPHFLFNSLNTVASLIPDDPILAERTLERLADVLRFALESSAHRTVPLRRELAITRDYLELHEARFGDRLRWTIDADPRADELPVPPLMLQPLVENAVLHGMSQRAEGGEVHIRTWRDETHLFLEVTDDGPGPNGSEHRGTGTSLRDLRARLALVYGDDTTLETGAAAGGGFRVSIRIPTATEGA